MAVYTLCGGDKCCPVVEVLDDMVKIGEDGNMVKLKKDEWKLLVGKIKSGEIQ
jgi:hypothetical protein